MTESSPRPETNSPEGKQQRSFAERLSDLTDTELDETLKNSLSRLIDELAALGSKNRLLSPEVTQLVVDRAYLFCLLDQENRQRSAARTQTTPPSDVPDPAEEETYTYSILVWEGKRDQLVSRMVREVYSVFQSSTRLKLPWATKASTKPPCDDQALRDKITKLAWLLSLVSQKLYDRRRLIPIGPEPAAPEPVAAPAEAPAAVPQPAAEPVAQPEAERPIEVERSWQERHEALPAPEFAKLIADVISLLAKEREDGDGKLRDVHSLTELASNHELIRDGDLVCLPSTKHAGYTFVVGDLHGGLAVWEQILTDTKLRERLQQGEAIQLVVLGDMIDRGARDVELLQSLLSLKLTYPQNVTLLRGDHETREIHSRPNMGFAQRIQSTYPESGNQSARLAELNTLFDLLPYLAATPEGTVFAHGGIPLDEAQKLGDLSALSAAGREAVLWSDPGPDEQTELFTVNSSRLGGGISEEEARKHFPGVVTFSQQALEKFLRAVSGRWLVRGHEHAQSGKLRFGNRLITLTTSVVHAKYGYPVVFGRSTDEDGIELCPLSDVEAVKVMESRDQNPAQTVFTFWSPPPAPAEAAQATEAKPEYASAKEKIQQAQAIYERYIPVRDAYEALEAQYDQATDEERGRLDLLQACNEHWRRLQQISAEMIDLLLIPASTLSGFDHELQREGTSLAELIATHTAEETLTILQERNRTQRYGRDKLHSASPDQKHAASQAYRTLAPDQQAQVDVALRARGIDPEAIAKLAEQS